MPLKHLVNVAYESATCELRDVNVIDHFHYDAYEKYSVNYNRDVDAFPLLRRIVEKITGKPSFYKSPTDMGVNCAGFGVTDDAAVTEASKQEIVRRFFRYSCEYAMGLVDKGTVERAELIMKEIGAKPSDRVVVEFAKKSAWDAKQKKKGNDGFYCGAAIELKDGTIVTGNNTELMHASSALVLNTVKHLAKIPKDIHLLQPNITESIGYLKKDVFLRKGISLDLEETLISLSISATFNPSASVAVEKLKELRGCELHLTHLPSPGDEVGLRKLGINVTSNPEFASKQLFIS